MTVNMANLCDVYVSVQDYGFGHDFDCASVQKWGSVWHTQKAHRCRTALMLELPVKLRIVSETCSRGLGKSAYERKHQAERKPYLGTVSGAPNSPKVGHMSCTIMIIFLPILPRGSNVVPFGYDLFFCSGIIICCQKRNYT